MENRLKPAPPAQMPGTVSRSTGQGRLLAVFLWLGQRPTAVRTSLASWQWFQVFGKCRDGVGVPVHPLGLRLSRRLGGTEVVASWAERYAGTGSARRA
jgi:hypothetical protein